MGVASVLRFPADTIETRGRAMALSQEHRRSIFTKLAPTLGEEETEALLSQFPTDPSAEPVTRARFDAALAELRAGIDRRETGLRADMGQLDTGLRADMGQLETTLRSDMSQLETTVRADIDRLDARIHGDMARLEASLVERMRQHVVWSFGVLLSGMGIAAAISQAIG